MARFLITCWPFPGHLYPQIAIAIALRERGHEVAFYTDGKVADLLAAENFRLFPFQQIDQRAVEDKLFSAAQDFSKPSNGPRFANQLKEWMVDTIPQQVRDLEPILASFKPDAIACDQAMWAPLHVFREKQRIPVAISAFCPCCMIPGPDAPPFGLGLPRPRDFRTRLMSRAVSLGQLFVGAPFRKALNEVRTGYGLPRLRVSALAYLAEVPLYLIPCSPEFDYSRKDLPASVHYVGPYIWNQPGTVTTPVWLSDVRRDRPWVHVTEGTVHLREPFVLRAAAQGLAGLEMEVLMTSGGARDPESIDLGAESANLHLARWIPHSDLLPRTDVIVTTGGAGTVLAAIAAHVPMVLIPTEWDKPEIAQRVVESGAGIRILPSRVTARSVREAVTNILGDSSFKRNVVSLANGFARFGGAAEAARLLEGLADQSKVRTKMPNDEKQ